MDWKVVVYAAIAAVTVTLTVAGTIQSGPKLGLVLLGLGVFLAAIYRYPNLRLVEIIAFGAARHIFKPRGADRVRSREELNQLWAEMKKADSAQ